MNVMNAHLGVLTIDNPIVQIDKVEYQYDVRETDWTTTPDPVISLFLWCDSIDNFNDFGVNFSKKSYKEQLYN